MICIRKIVLTFFVCIVFGAGTGVLFADGKDGRNYREFELWHKLLHYSLSSDSEWAMWSIQSGWEQDSLFIRNLKSGREYKYFRTGIPQFSDDSRWAAFSVPNENAKKNEVAYQVKLVNLETAEEIDFRGMESFSFIKGGRFLLLKATGKGSASELNLYHLEKRQIKNIANIQEYVVAPTGKYLAYIIKTATGEGNGVEVMDLTDLRVFLPESGGKGYEKLQWTDKGLVFMKVLLDSLSQDRGREIGVVRNIGAKQQEFKLAVDHLGDFPAGMKVSEFYAPRWSRDGKILFFGIIPQREPTEAVKGDKAEVDVWHWQDQEIQSRQKKRYYMDRSRTYLCAWLPETNQWRRVADTMLFDVAGISPNGMYVLMRDDRPYRPHYRESHNDIYVVHTLTGKRTLLLENTILSLSFSREGKYIYYFKDKNWWAYDLAKEKHINLTSSIEVGLSNRYYDGPIEIEPSFGVAGWLKGDKALWFYDEYDIWSVEPETLRLKRLTYGREDKMTFRKMQRGELEPAKNLLLKADMDDGQLGIFRFDEKGKHQQLMLGAHNLLKLDKSTDGKAYLFGLDDNVTASELFFCDGDFKHIRQLTANNLPQDEFVFRKSELVRYKNSKGEELKGALFYPVNYREGETYPMIVHIYEKLSDKLNNFVFPSAQEAYNTANYVLDGYFVFQPDITYEVNRPGESSADCVVAGVQEVLKRKDVDSLRIGLIGHSWGAYQTAYIISQTSLFAAAVAGAPLTDMVSMYNSVYWETGRANQQMFETSQARFRLPWWQIPEHYIKNSPVFQSEKIQTPLLISFGEEDMSVNWSQGLEMYITMRRLGKPCILLGYQNEGHTIGGKANALDQTRRVMDYFGYYLKKKSPASWILDGCSYLEKKGER